MAHFAERTTRAPLHAGSSAREVTSALGPGRALDAPVRKRMESAFEHDFSNVRIHDDSTAAALSRNLGASAFTLAEHVAFADYGYRPGVPAGDRLLAHELAHVIQQSGGHAATRGPDALEADADHSADGVVTGRSGRHGPRLRGGVRVACQPARQAAPGPTFYDAVPHSIIAKPPGTTAADMDRELKVEKTAGNITSWRADGVRPDSIEALFILWAIWQLSHTKFWDREVDLVTEIGPGKRGAVTVRIDAGGNAVGVLVSAAEPTVAARYKTVDDAVKDLTARYKLKAVVGEKGKQWSPDDLNKVAAAWSRLDKGGAAALEGYSLIRTDDTLALDDGTLVAGLTTTGNHVAADGLSSTRVRELRFADRAFARLGTTGDLKGKLTGDAVSFVGDATNAAPASTQTILHEAGHAQERQLSVDAGSEYEEAQVAKRRDSGIASTQEAALGAATTTALAGWAKQKGARKAAGKAFVAAFRVVTDAIEAMRQADVALKAEPLRQVARAAVGARDKARAAVPASNPVLTLFDPPVSAQDAYLAAVEALLTSRQAIETANTHVTAAKDPTGKTSARLQRFVKYVNENHIPPITGYAKENWLTLPGEFYAEAFSLWLADPTFLGSASPALKKWFDGGEHLK